MRLRFLLFFLAVWIGDLHAQVTFDRGTITDISGKTIDCLIRNEGWVNSPASVSYKLSDNSEVQTLTVKDIKEFRIDSIASYVRAKVKVDMSSSNVAYYSTKRDPEWQEMDVLLKVLVEGQKARLYSWRSKNLQRFFYSRPDGTIEQLVYKKYIVDEKSFINNRYREQLKQLAEQTGAVDLDASGVQYDTSSLISFFMAVNGQSAKKMIRKEKGDFNLRVAAGLTMAGVKYGNGSDVKEFDSAVNPNFSMEAEYIFGFNRSKWAVIAGIGFTSYKPDPISMVSQNDTTLDYTSIEIPVGLRYYMFLSHDTRLSLDGGIMTAVPVNADFKDTYSTLEIETGRNVFLSASFDWKRFGIRLRYNSQRELIVYNSLSAKYNNTTVSLTCKLF